MKAIKSIFCLGFAVLTLSGCNSKETIVIGASPSPHSQILECQEFKDYISSKGYNLEIKVYQDYVTPNKALDDGGIDANYFQHIPYLTEEVTTKGYKLSAACTVHNEPLNLYGINKITDFSNKTISIIDDVSNVERAFKLLQANNIITSYSVENFDSQHPVYTTDIGVTIECINAGLLHLKVEEGGYAVINGNYALTAWSTATATSYKIFGESTEVAYPNVIAVRTSDIKSAKTNTIVEAFAQPFVKTFIENTFGPTVNYSYQDLRN